MPSEIDPRLVLLAEEDNCLVAAQRLSAGDSVTVDGTGIVLPEGVGLGHKIARTALPTGTVILKYGAPIGRLNTTVTAGAHIHTHNLESAYTPTWTQENVADYIGGERG